ncbi:MAG: (2Fe-2S)-binding protein, partial [Anaerolineae bacterium]|nr:(2Fe-2S)-binding protein [Anaerolineae bacterium]
MTISLTINNNTVKTPDGATILDAARLAGIEIPTLGHHPDLSNV